MTSKTTKNIVYRYRSPQGLWGDHDELCSQTIYFAPLDKLNDPVEGYVDYLWDGDTIVWFNFFKNYFYSLTNCWADYVQFMTEQDHKFGRPVIVNFEQYFFKEELKVVRDNAFSKFSSARAVMNIISLLDEINEPIRRTELLFYMKAIHTHALGILYEEAEILKIVKPNNGKSYIGTNQNSLVNNSFSKEFLARINSEIVTYAKDHNVTRDEAMNETVQPGFMSPLFIQGRRDLSNEEMFLNYEFPNSYIEKIDGLIFPDLYVASFSKTFDDSSMWGQYAGSHEGACLEFNLKSDKSLDLTSTSSNKKTINQFMFDVSYIGYKEVNFFKSIFLISRKAILNLWCTGIDGNKSELWDSYSDDDQRKVAYKNHILQKVLNKSADWVHEDECRLVLPDTANNYSDQTNRVMKYSVKSLSGITFGIKTADLHKKQTVDYYRSTYDNETISRIKLYQAYYSHADQSVKRYKINIDGFG